MNEFTNWAALVTLPGAMIIVLLIAQYTKAWIPQTFDTRLYVLILSLVVTQAAAFVLGWTLPEHLLMVINAFFVAAAAMGSYGENAFKFKQSDDEAKRITRGPII